MYPKTIAVTSDIPDKNTLVTTNTSQTITGYKTFSDGLSSVRASIGEILDNIKIKDGDYDSYINITSDGTIKISNDSGIIDGVLNLPHAGTTSSPKTIAVTSDIPDAYIKDASVSGNTLTLTKKDDTTVNFTALVEPPSNMVTTDTNQIITGIKSFGTLQAASLTDGTTTKTMTEVLAGGGGSTTYMHSLKLSGRQDVRALLALTTIYTKSETPFDKDTLTA